MSGGGLCRQSVAVGGVSVSVEGIGCWCYPKCNIERLKTRFCVSPPTLQEITLGINGILLWLSSNVAKPLTVCTGSNPIKQPTDQMRNEANN